ncbi:MAG: 3D domain-containing protein [bacterium]|nr:3D domain-containing protein [bacterium]
MRRARAAALAGLLAGIAPTPAPAAENPVAFEAAAYTLKGRTAAGTWTRRGVVAADPRVLAIGTHIRIEGAGHLSGVYRVEDTGSAVRGREIDIYVPTAREARSFGRRTVRVHVLSRGDGDLD